MMSTPCQSEKHRRGATAVEFAVCFPVALSLLFGIIEFARVMQIQQTIRQAAFEGARAGVPLDSTTADVTNGVNNMLQAVSLSHVTTTITPNPVTYLSPTVTVAVTVDPAQTGWLTWFVTAGHPITSTITLNREVQSISVPGP